MAFADRSCCPSQGVQEISRFSCMLYLSVRGFSDYAGPSHHSRLTWLPCCLPPLGMESASCSIGFSKLNSPAHRYLCLRFKWHLAMPPARLEARMESLFSFPVGIFHPLQHAGLSRRSPDCRRFARTIFWVQKATSSGAAQIETGAGQRRRWACRPRNRAD